ncbi:Transmembrane gamma-carboxyglutamic acid protein 2 [Varanus komodoensis]|nr:Transmembrane gamma-carboxyglutamic acid protein 2 [Varanus komodoensis]
MRSPQCLLLLFQALVPGLAGSSERHPEHEHAQEDPVFLDDPTALRFLGRKPLYNRWDFELIVPDNLERECKEEVCNYEEAREVFEDDILTAEYGDRPWAGLEDGYLRTAKRKTKKKRLRFALYLHGLIYLPRCTIRIIQTNK